MRFVLLLVALAMPAVSYLSQLGWLGPDNGEISDRYPTLLVAAGYAFAVWGLIFLLDIAYAVATARSDEGLERVTPLAIAGFALTAVWSPVFTLQIFWLALLIIVGALTTLTLAAIRAQRAPSQGAAAKLARIALPLHAGWLALAAFLNLAQVLVAFGVDPALGWSLVLFAASAAVLLLVNQRLGGSLVYTGVALWGLVAVYVKQSGHELAGSDVAAWVAVGIAVLLAAHTAWLRLARGGAEG